MDLENAHRCSKSCIRAASAILLLSAIAISFLASLDKTRALNDLLQYTSLRVNMKEELNGLEADRAWTHLKKQAGETVTTSTIADLLRYRAEVDYQVVYPGADKEKRTEAQSKKTQTDETVPAREGQPSAPKTLKDSKEAASPPAAPSALTGKSTGATRTVKEPIQPILAIATALTILTDDAVLHRSRSYSHRYNLSIHGWQRFWYRLRSTAYILPHEYPKDVSPIVLSMNFAQVVELLNYNLPTISDVETLYKEQSSITLPSLGMPVGLLAATLFVESGLMLCIFYFWIWYREAAASDDFPAPGTLFSALARTRLSRSIFLLLIWVPATAGVLLAWKSYWSTSLNAVIASAVVFLSLVVLKEAWLLVFRVPFTSSMPLIRKFLVKKPLENAPDQSRNSKTSERESDDGK